jgi:formyltetrahydrofolate synthetase
MTKLKERIMAKKSVTVPSDIEIAQACKVKPISEIAEQVGVLPEELELYGNYKAKVSLDVRERLAKKKNGKYIDVTAITPTPLGEGKTTTTVGLSQALGAHLNKNVITCIRQPSMGPTFGIKGGAAGGGYSQIVPMEDFNLHLTGDLHAVGVAHNLLAAAIDSRIMHERNMSDERLFKALFPKDKWSPCLKRRAKKLGIKIVTPSKMKAADKVRLCRLDIDPYSVSWNRVVDINDRAMRDIVIGVGGKNNGYPRESGFDITVASEVMAILALSTSLEDMRDRIGRIVVATSRKGDPITAEDLGTAGAMTVLMKDAIKPTLMQTLEGTPAFVHAGPFANIAHGNSSIISDQIALKLADYVVTESGFGADIGMEKFMNIKCRYSKLKPDCVVLVATVRSLKMHGGCGKVVAGKPLPPELTTENLPALKKGAANMVACINIAKQFGVPVVVAINVFKDDTDKEVDLLKQIAKKAGAEGAYRSDHWAQGGAGSVELGEAVVKACEKKSKFKFLYKDSDSIKKKIEAIAKKVYGADGVDYSDVAEKQIAKYEKLGYGKLPICMAKTHLSLSHDPSLKNVPKGFRVPVREVRASVGAGFVYPLLGAMRTMPGLPSRPVFYDVDIDFETGKVVGLF